MSISVASIGFVLPQIRHLTMKRDFVPYNPYLKIRIIKSKMKRLFIKNELKFLKRMWKNMRNRTIGINVRVSENEKKNYRKMPKSLT